MKPFSEEMRYEYDLVPDSMVLDCGGHQGVFAEEIFKRYGCNIEIYEPVPQFAQRIRSLFQTPKVHVHERAIGGQLFLVVDLSVQGDSSGAFGSSDETVEAKVVPFSMVIHGARNVDLAKLNIEGMEYDAMEDALMMGVQNKVKNFQIQFHPNAPDYHARRMWIQDELRKTHYLTYEYPYVWENWRRNDD